jgi:hypothetical protein
MNLPIDKPATTNLLRHCYNHRDFSFGNSDAGTVIALVGSCRIVPFLNFMRVFNHAHGYPFELLCFNPVEMWEGPGHEVDAGVAKVLDGYRFGKVDFLIGEHVQNCGYLNTVRSSEQNVFDSLGCDPRVEIRLPNWNAMHIFDAETAMYDPEYCALDPSERAVVLRERTNLHKAKFLDYCAKSSFPDLAQWVTDHWLTLRMGWTNSHPSIELSLEMFRHVATALQLPLDEAFYAHPLCVTDGYKPSGMVLTPVDYEANGWQF